MKKLIADEKQLRKKMIDLGITSIGELANKSGVSKPTIYEYLNGKSPFSDAYLRLCSFLELDPRDILTERDLLEDE